MTSPHLAVMLENHAQILRLAKRDDEAEKLEVRVKAIKALKPVKWVEPVK